MEACTLHTVLAVMVLLLLAASAGGAAEGYRVVVPNAASPVVRHAGEELARYLRQMTDVPVSIGDSDGDSLAVFVLGGPASNPTAKALVASDKLREPEQWASETSPDAFYIASAKSDGKSYVVLAGKSDVGILYAVYDYLERYGGCGFFEDGDFVPHKAPKVSGVDYFSSPRFAIREFHADLCASYGLKKFHFMHRTMEDWLPFYDWLAKRKINLSAALTFVNGALGGDAIEMGFGIKDDQPGERYGGGWPSGWTWPAKERTRIMRKRLAYQRSLGVKHLYGFIFGQTPIPFKEAHPELKWVEVSYGHALLHPDEPLAYELTKKFYQACVDLYGTDHFYTDTPYSECAGVDDLDASLKLKIDAANKACRIFKEIDPKATWLCDSWDFSALPALWTPERKKKFFASIPKDMTFFFDAATDMVEHYASSDHFYGVPWGIGILHSFQGDDHLHGDLAALIHTVQKAADDPESGKLSGYFNIMELHAANILYWQLSTELAWNPRGVTVEGYLHDFALQRYGDASYPKMRQALDEVVKAVYSGQNVQPMYHKLGCTYMNYSFPAIDENSQTEGMQFPGLPGSIESLGKAVRLALTQEDAQRGNPLYENDVLDWTKSYLQHLFNYSTIRAYHAYRDGDKAQIREWSDAASKALTCIESILSTRPDFSLQATIDQAMSVPGTNPSTPRMIRQHCVNDLYAVNDNYEQVRLFYRPRMEIYFKSLAQRAEAGERTIGWADVSKECEKIRANWLDNSAAVPAAEHFHGTTMEAIHAALDAFRGIERNVVRSSESRAKSQKADVRQQGNVKG
jgi:hypothetical protein